MDGSDDIVCTIEPKSVSTSRTRAWETPVSYALVLELETHPGSMVHIISSEPSIHFFYFLASSFIPIKLEK